jgi:putative PIN family toxin of toxin-antitoxin system
VRVVLDTNVLISGVFFAGAPSEILKAWSDDRFELVLSEEIIEEYQRVGEVLGRRFPGVSLWPILELIVARARICLSPRLPEGVCDDPADDKFLACALAGGARVIVSGDKALLRTSGYGGVKVMTPRQFISLYLEQR